LVIILVSFWLTTVTKDLILVEGRAVMTITITGMLVFIVVISFDVVWLLLLLSAILFFLFNFFNKFELFLMPFIEFSL